MDGPLFTCILLSHNKPEFVVEAISSLVRQTFQNFEGIVVDSGVLYDQGFFDNLPAMADPRIRLVRSDETEELRGAKTVASWCFNECFRRKLVRGRFITYLCDDDLLYPDAFEIFHRTLEERPATMAMYGSVDMTVVNAKGRKYYIREIAAQELKGRCCQGGPLDRYVDYLQFCHHIDAIRSFPTDEYWPEDPAAMDHADGIFMEAIGDRFPVVPVSGKIGENRKVPQSLNDGGARAEWLAENCRRNEADRRLEARLGILGRFLVRSRIVRCLRPPFPRRPPANAA